MGAIVREEEGEAGVGGGRWVVEAVDGERHDFQTGDTIRSVFNPLASFPAPHSALFSEVWYVREGKGGRFPSQGHDKVDL